MPNLWTKLKAWFKSQPKKPTKPKFKPINHRHYRKLIGKIAKQAIAEQRARQKERSKP